MNKIVGSDKDYKDFVATVTELDDDDFPILIERKDPMSITVTDIKDFIDQFKNDTGLDVYFRLSTCDDCGQLHMCMVIDIKEEIQYGKLHIIQ